MHIVCFTDGRLCSMKYIGLYKKNIIKYFSNLVEGTAGYIEVLFLKHKI